MDAVGSSQPRASHPMVQSGDCAARRPVRRALRERGPNNFITTRGQVMSCRVWVLVGVLLAVLTITVVARGRADKRQQWASSKHANRELAREEATVEKRGETAAHCGRCHSEQGFLAWLPQLEKGNTGLITKPDGSPADVPYLAGLGLTRFSVRPVTCAACHKSDLSIRVTARTPVLPAGFRALGVGAGGPGLSRPPP